MSCLIELTFLLAPYGEVPFSCETSCCAFTTAHPRYRLIESPRRTCLQGLDNTSGSKLSSNYPVISWVYVSVAGPGGVGQGGAGRLHHPDSLADEIERALRVGQRDVVRVGL